MNPIYGGRKPRGDSRLKTLPPERQKEIASYAENHTLAEIVAWLRADGLVTNVASLSVFLSWHEEQLQLRQDALAQAAFDKEKQEDDTARKRLDLKKSARRKRGNGAMGVSYRQPNSNSRLKTLPEARQAEIASFRGSLVETVKWLAGSGVVTNIASLSDFLAWHRVQNASRSNGRRVAEIIAAARAKNPDVPRDELERAAARAFGVLALDQKDMPGFLKRHENAAKFMRAEVPA